MKIAELSDFAKLSAAQALFANECNSRQSLVYVFSWAGGASGLSFGMFQIDVAHSAYAVLALRDIGFTTDEIAWLRAQHQPVAQLAGLGAYNAKLLAGREAVDRWDRKQLSDCLSWPLGLCTEIGADFSCEEAFVHIADYHNQFGMSRGGKLYRFLQAAQAAVTPEMIRDFKYTLPYGVEQRAKPQGADDVWRRYWNIVRIMRPDEGAQ